MLRFCLPQNAALSAAALDVQKRKSLFTDKTPFLMSVSHGIPFRGGLATCKLLFKRLTTCKLANMLNCRVFHKAFKCSIITH